MHLTGSHMYALNRITRVCIKGSHLCIKQNHTYALNRITVYALNIITKVCIEHNHKGMHLPGSHMYAFNRITHVCI